MSDRLVTFLVTVTYRCPNMIDAETLKTEYGDDPLVAYKNISDNFGDHPDNFGDQMPETTKVEIEK